MHIHSPLNPLDSPHATRPQTDTRYRAMAASSIHRRLNRHLRAALAGLLVCAAPVSAWACATCGCSLSSDAANGYSVTSGWRVNLQYDYINQNQLRSGADTASPTQVVNKPTTGELENQTLNRYLTLGVSYSPNANWNINLQIPYVIRSHSTYGNPPQPFGPADVSSSNLSSSNSSSVGDVKIIGSYQGFLPMHNLGVQLGLKLPTGRYGNDVVFSSGPNAGSPLDTSLQPGTGSTDLIVGAYYYQALNQDWDAFVNGSFQAAVRKKLDQPGNNYRPGNLTSLSLGVRYEANPQWVPQLQVNLSHKSSDQGARADTLDTAGTVAYLSPGITVSVVKGLQLYGFVQIPVYSRLDGYQLFPRWTTTVGASHAF